MDNFTKIKNDFDTSAKAIAEKEKMYMDNARRAGPEKKGKGNSTTGSTNGNGDRRDVESEPNPDQWKTFDQANIESNIVKQRQEDLNQIERLMNEVNQMTNDMAVEVANADAKLDQIGANARSTRDQTKKGTVELAKGAEYQKKSYKRICCVVWLLILALGIVAMVVIFKLT